MTDTTKDKGAPTPSGGLPEKPAGIVIAGKLADQALP